MHPYDHARSSARTHGGQWPDYFALHSWFDATEALQCRFTHRALRHHLEGVQEAIAVFGPVLRNSDGAEIETQTLGLQHLEEDSPDVVNAVAWLVGFDRPDWLPTISPGPDTMAHDSSHLVFRHHAFGVFEAEARFGPVIALSPDKAVPTRGGGGTPRPGRARSCAARNRFPPTDQG